MSEELKGTLKYLKNKSNTRRIKTITISEAHKVVEEIEKLNNIINEIEKYINEEYDYDDIGMKIFDASKIRDKLQELKGSNNNE